LPAAPARRVPLVHKAFLAATAPMASPACRAPRDPLARPA
jgi:hypothetical protein